MTIGDVITLLKEAVPNMPKDGPLSGSNDTLKVGREAAEVTGVVTTFLATAEVVEKTAAFGANLIITHEPTFYHYQDDSTTFLDDPITRQKVQALAAYDISVFRYHDYWHMHRPDGIYTGVISQMGWQKYWEQDSLFAFSLPATPLKDVIGEIKKIFGVETVRFIGDEDELHERIGLFVGSPGPHWQIPSISADKLDLLICGEVAEWELAEYVRDARFYGHKLALIVFGHQPSEEAGMAYLARWLTPKLPGVPVTHISSDYPLRYS